VVERPASVIKELLENSLDAGATTVSVEIEGGGRTFIRVTDDGSGMERGDAERAIERHATSKLRELSDLQSVVTHGFREMGLTLIRALVMVDNNASIRLLEKLGFQRTQTLGAFRTCGGVVRDFYAYELRPF
jgi:DNA mismatch repair protein MutL